MSFRKHYLLTIIIGVFSIFLLPVPAFAHVVVKPNTVGIATFQTFTVGVPNEKDSPTVAVKLLIPAGVKYISPNVKQGWTIDVKKSGEGEDAPVTEIDWTDGAIPAGQRDDFLFSAQVPASEGVLKWKALQTYADGSTVEWTHDPTNDPEDDSAPPPYSTTKVINDLANPPVLKSENNSKVPMIFSLVALALSSLSLGIVLRRKK